MRVDDRDGPATPVVRPGRARRPGASLLVLAVAAALLLGACGPDAPTAPTPAQTAATPHPSPTAAGSHSSTAGGTGAGRSRATTVVFVDVGQGDAAVIRSGSWSGLVDGGRQGSERAVEAALRRLGVRRLSAVVVSHMHADHTGGLARLVGEWRPRAAYVAGRPTAALARVFGAARTRVVQARRGATFRCGAARARVLSPAGLSGDPNGDSLVVELEAGGRRFLFTGDCAGPSDAAVGQICARGPPVTVLKVAHHGSRYSTSAAFLAGARPRIAVVSVGPNAYGHPTPATLRRLLHAGARIYTTWKNGDVTFRVTTAGGMAVSFSRSKQPLTRATSTGD